MPKPQPVLTITGVRDTLRSLNRIERDVKEAAVSEMDRELSPLAEAVLRRTPYDTGALADSLAVHRRAVDVGRTTRYALGLGASLSIGDEQTADYASPIERRYGMLKLSALHRRQAFQAAVFNRVSAMLKW